MVMKLVDETAGLWKRRGPQAEESGRHGRWEESREEKSSSFSGFEDERLAGGCGREVAQMEKFHPLGRGNIDRVGGAVFKADG